MVESYNGSEQHLQPVVLIYPGFLDLRLFDRLYEDNDEYVIKESLSDKQKILDVLEREGPKSVKELQAITNYKSRNQFLLKIIKPLIAEGIIYRDGNAKSPTACIKLKN